MKNGAAVLILIATVSCTTGGSAGSGGNPPPSIAFALPPQWTETFTREPTLPEPTVSSAREQTLPGQPAETEPTGDLDGAAVFEKVVTLDADGEPVVGIDYSPKWGLLVSISDRGVVRLWDTDDGTLLVLRETDSRGWASILLDPDADFFVLGLDEKIEIRSAETAEIIRAYTDNLIHHLLGMAFFPDRQLMAVTGEYGLQLFAGVSKDPAVRPKRLDTYFEAKAATQNSDTEGPSTAKVCCTFPMWTIARTDSASTAGRAARCTAGMEASWTCNFPPRVGWRWPVKPPSRCTTNRGGKSPRPRCQTSPVFRSSAMTPCLFAALPTAG
jgi:hypothetical protein